MSVCVLKALEHIRIITKDAFAICLLIRMVMTRCVVKYFKYTLATDWQKLAFLFPNVQRWNEVTNLKWGMSHEQPNLEQYSYYTL